MLNLPLVKSFTRQPRGFVKLNGVAVTGWIDLEVDNNTFYQADTFSVTFAATMLPDGYSVDWFASQQLITVEIFAGFPASAESFTQSELTSLIYGNVDGVNYDPVNATIEISGRDLTSLLIDAKTTKKYQNQTASEIATSIAKAHGLTPVVTKTTTKSGTYYEIDHDRLSAARSEWDLLTYLALEEEFNVYVKGRELHFEPKVDPSENPYVLQWSPSTDIKGYSTFNGTDIKFSRNLTIAKGVVVVVRSWNRKTGKTHVETYPTSRARGIAPGQSSAPAQIYERNRSNLTPEKALQYAQSIHKEITAHEVSLTACLPADDILTARNLIQVSGTGTAFDQIYYPDSIRRSLSIDSGYKMDISAKNHSPSNEVTI